MIRATAAGKSRRLAFEIGMDAAAWIALALFAAVLIGGAIEIDEAVRAALRRRLGHRKRTIR